MLSETPSEATNRVNSGEIVALNGVRGLAILGVLLVHSFYGVSIQFPPATAVLLNKFSDAGVFGVDLFFVLSGFLITSILLRRRTEPHYFKNFYARRFLRLFPLYYLYLAIAAFALPFFHRLTHSTMGDYAGNWWWYIAYLSNWKPGHGAHDPFLGHFWSLAVEEQFYLIWPAVVLLLSRRRLAVTCFGIIVAATSLRAVMLANDADWNTVYRLTVTRFDTLAYGAVVALAMQSPQWRKRFVRWAKPVGLSASAAFVILCCYADGPSWEAPEIALWSPVLTGCAFASLIAFAATNPKGILTAWWLTAAGRYSYAAYVLHVVIFNYGISLEAKISQSMSNQTYRIVMACGMLMLNWAAVFAAAALSGRYFERPILAFKKRFENPAPRPSPHASAETLSVS